MKRDIVDDTTPASLSELNLLDAALLKKSANIDIGFTADAEFRQLQRSTRPKVSERDGLALRCECRAFMSEIVVRTIESAIQIQRCAQLIVH